MKILKYIAYVLFAIAFIVIVTYITLALSDSEVCKIIKYNMSNNIGDFSWGTIGISLTFVSTLFMVLTFTFQQKQFKETKQDEFRTRFEGTFFNMLSMFYNVRNQANKQIEISTNGSMKSLNDFYKSLKDNYEKYIKENKDFSDAMNILEKDIILPTQYKTALYDLGNFYDQNVQELKCNAGFYYRFAHNLITFVLGHWRDCDDDIHMYLNFIQAQMSDEELALVFYDCISQKGLDKNRKYTFKNNLDKYSFLENVPESLLLSRCHYKVFANTLFGFLNEDERKKVRNKCKETE